MIQSTLIRLALLAAVSSTFLSLGCKRSPPAEAAPNDDHTRASPAPTNHIDVPDSVRRNLGITFAKVESRAVTRTIRAPGRFELQPQARREYRTNLGGRVDLNVVQYQRVQPGTLLYTLDSPAWRELQQRLNETDAAVLQSAARVAMIDPLMAAHHEHELTLHSAVELWNQRVAQLAQSNSGVITAEELAQARSMVATNRAELSEVIEKEAELEARRVEVRSELAAARERFELLLMNASSLLSIQKSRLESPADPALERHGPLAADESRDRHPLWREIQMVEVRATHPGIVESFALTNGAWASEASLILTIVQPELIRFRARAMQSDLGRLRDGLPATIVPPPGGSVDPSAAMHDLITLGLAADPDQRTIELLVTPSAPPAWARAGVTAHLEVVVDGTSQPEPAIPVAATIRDGLVTVFFRRNPKDPDEVVRVEADLGPTDGRWVVVRSGVKAGDEVVLDGVYQLMLATSGVAQKGGHFHADGTFHEGKD
jgi:multidrug resistance efflux pump